MPTSTSPSRRRAIPKPPGQAAGGTRHRPALDVRRHAASAEGPQLRPHREKPVLCRRKRATADRVPRTLFPASMSATISPPAWKTNSTKSPAGARGGSRLLEKFWKDFKPKSDEVMEKKPSEVTEALDEFLSDYLFPPTKDAAPIRGSARNAAKDGLSLARRALRRVRRLLELPRMQVHPQVRPARRHCRWRRRCGARQTSGNRRDRSSARPGGSGLTCRWARARKPRARLSRRTSASLISIGR